MQLGSIRHLFRLKRACKTEANLKYVFYIPRDLVVVLQCSFIFALFFRFASVLEGTGKGADYEEGKQK